MTLDFINFSNNLENYLEKPPVPKESGKKTFTKHICIDISVFSAEHHE